MKYNITINQYDDTQSPRVDGLFYITVYENSNHNNPEHFHNMFNNKTITKLTKKAYKKLCVNPVTRENEIWFKNYKDADMTKQILRNILN